MAIGDSNDFITRINAVLPSWFSGTSNPILTGLLAAYSNTGVFIYNQELYVQLQTRISTATDNNLDLIANDFFGVNNFPRGANEGDASYRSRILASIVRERATRRGMSNVLTLLTGYAPLIQVPSNPGDCGGYAVAGCGYGVAGIWSNPLPPSTAYQCFITVYTSVSSGIASVPGWNIDYAAWNISGTRTSWVNSFQFNDALNATQIYQVINSTKIEGSTCWVLITNPPA
jgi:hypothetical protein